MISYVNNYFLCTWMSVGLRKCSSARRAAERGYVCECVGGVCVDIMCVGVYVCMQVYGYM